MRQESIDEFNVNGLEVFIQYDDGPHDYPFEDDTGVDIITFDRNSTISDRHNYSDPADALEAAEAAGLKVYPLYKYEHGLVCYRTSAFSCPWDSGQAGFVFVTPSEVGDPDKAAEAACETLTDWCNGSIYGYMIEDPNGEHLESCWGFYGADFCKEEAIAVAQVEARDYWDGAWTAQAAELEASRPDMYGRAA